MFAIFTFRRTLGLIALTCTVIMGYALYLQHVVGLIPCPMCIVQRYAMTLLALFSALAVLFGRTPSSFAMTKQKPRALGRVCAFLALVAAGFGAFVAARQSWIQWYPPEMMSCGRDFYAMIEQLPLNRFVPLIFKGSGDCAAVEYILPGLTIANLSFIAFMGMALLIARALLKASNHKGEDIVLGPRC